MKARSRCVVKMMRLLLLCLLLMSVTASEEMEGSAGEDSDDEDLIKRNDVIQTKKEYPVLKTGADVGSDSVLEKTTGVQEESDQFLLIVVVVAVSVVALSVAAIVAVVLVRRNLNSRQQGVYSVPTEQGQKGAV